MKKFALDYGNRCVISNGSNPDSLIVYYKTLVDVAQSLPENSIVIAERSIGSYDWDDRNHCFDICKERNITVLTINPNATKNLRYDLPDEDSRKEKTDENDARLIYQIGHETNYRCGNFKKINAPKIDGVDKIKDTNTLIRIARRPRNKYKEEIKWLKKHNLPTYSTYCQWVIVARYIHKIKGNRNDFDFTCGLYGMGQRGIVRASANRDLLRGEMKRNKKNINDRIARKEFLRKIKKTSREIYHLVNEELKNGTAVSEKDTSVSILSSFI